MTEDLHYPSADEVNELLTKAEEFVDTQVDVCYRRLLFAAYGCRAEALAYSDLAELVEELEATS